MSQFTLEYLADYGGGSSDGEPHERPIATDVASSFVQLAEGYFADDERGRDPLPSGGDGVCVDCDGEPVIDEGGLVEDLGEIFPTIATSMRVHVCTLCSVAIDTDTRRRVWSWTSDQPMRWGVEDETTIDRQYVLHAHLGCDAIRREIDLAEWSQGDVLDRIVAWCQEDLLNHDLDELLEALTVEERDDMGAELVDAARRSLAL